MMIVTLPPADEMDNGPVWKFISMYGDDVGYGKRPVEAPRVWGYHPIRTEATECTHAEKNEVGFYAGNW
jgi:hypothetical protein